MGTTTSTCNPCTLNDETDKKDANMKKLIIQSQESEINDDSKENLSLNEYINGLSDETKTCISATHLFGNIWYSYFNDEENKCEYISDSQSDNKHNFDILDHILIRGGCCRDVLWNENFNDVDAVVNTRELNKLHLLHLKKY
eukprot:326864_1